MVLSTPHVIAYVRASVRMPPCLASMDSSPSLVLVSPASMKGVSETCVVLDNQSITTSMPSEQVYLNLMSFRFHSPLNALLNGCHHGGPGCGAGGSSCRSASQPGSVEAGRCWSRAVPVEEHCFWLARRAQRFSIDPRPWEAVAGWTWCS